MGVITRTSNLKPASEGMLEATPFKEKSCRFHLNYSRPMSNHEFLRRAFELADSGKYPSVQSIRKALERENFSLRELSQLGGKSLWQQLRARIAAARIRQDAG